MLTELQANSARILPETGGREKKSRSPWEGKEYAMTGCYE